jgi:hypothetical protein
VEAERDITAAEIAEEEDATAGPSLENADQAPEGEGADPQGAPGEPGRLGNSPTERQAGL